MLLAGPLVDCRADDSTREPPPASSIDAEIAQHIENLGHPSYAVRSRARYELTQLGLLAMDAIREAESSTDTEIAFAARYLMSTLEIRWAEETDPGEVREVLSDYNDLNSDERRNRMDRLANLAEPMAKVALARLARFEQSEWLSRWAAILAMRVTSDSEPLAPKYLERIRETLGSSQRVGVQWLRQYCLDVERQQFDADAWRTLLDNERRPVETNAVGEQYDPALLVELYRVSAARCLAYDDRPQALRLASEALDKVVARRQELLDSVRWALNIGLHEIVLELQQREPQRFAAEAELMYGVAEAYLQREEPAAAEASRLAALEINALPPPDSEAAEEMPAEQRERLAVRHRELAKDLQLRGLFAWAEGEYRHVIDRLPIDSMPAALNRSDLVEVLDYQRRHAEIVELLEPLVERLRKDRIFRSRFQSAYWQSADGLASLLEYHRGLAAEGEAARQALRMALTYSRDDADVLIAMHRLPGDAEWRDEVRREIERASRHFLREIALLEESLRRDPQNERVRLRLAVSCNQYAWLVGNTFGEVANALRISHRSLDLMPENPAFLDTLARCYYAAGDLEQAIQYQRRAIRLEPHVPPMREQLQMFLEAQSESQEEAAARRDAGGPDDQ
jgi:tetratricopeptide (TPR) repeat protein